MFTALTNHPAGLSVTFEEFMESMASVSLLIIEDFGIRTVRVNSGRGSAGQSRCPPRTRQPAA
jgi:hypothetical protein